MAMADERNTRANSSTLNITKDVQTTSWLSLQLESQHKAQPHPNPKK